MIISFPWHNLSYKSRHKLNLYVFFFFLFYLEGVKKKNEVNYWFHSRMKSLYRTFESSTRFWISWKTFMSSSSLLWPLFWWLYSKQYCTVYSDWDEHGEDVKHKCKFLFSFKQKSTDKKCDYILWTILNYSRDGNERYVPETVSKAVSRGSDFDVANDIDVSFL